MRLGGTSLPTDSQGRRGVALHIMERLDCTTLVVRDNVVKSFWVRIKGTDKIGKSDVHHQLLTQDNRKDGKFYRKLGEILGSVALAGNSNFPDIN